MHSGSYLGAEILNGNLLLTNISLLSIEKVMKINVSVKEQSILCRRAKWEPIRICAFVQHYSACKDQEGSGGQYHSTFLKYPCISLYESEIQSELKVSQIFKNICKI